MSALVVRPNVCWSRHRPHLRLPWCPLWGRYMGDNRTDATTATCYLVRHTQLPLSLSLPSLPPSLPSLSPYHLSLAAYLRDVVSLLWWLVSLYLWVYKMSQSPGYSIDQKDNPYTNFVLPASIWHWQATPEFWRSCQRLCTTDSGGWTTHQSICKNYIQRDDDISFRNLRCNLYQGLRFLVMPGGGATCRLPRNEENVEVQISRFL